MYYIACLIDRGLKQIQSLNYRIQQKCNTLFEKKQLLRSLKQLEGTRGRVIQNAALMTKIQHSMGQKEARIYFLE
ncbi:hypothetical protein AQUCO_02800302v1 [Aquilegia coerulea]|uniref:Uncharacterized protein n=1 Tax=Aquilegia coerulea TaxID=218851 RepID=A0A2G5CT18_AQUCA|nr:hypothetical protein AQUCO_03800212v1 [Aquilegia coerulea]PIA38496.1 hypothetical protein AQUCO_02800302v1 [Aquilegia coerulea]